MPLFMDVHKMPGVTKDLVAKAHEKDLLIQGKHGANYMRYWVNEKDGMVFCLVEAPSADAAKRVHAEAGHPTDEIYEVHEGQ